jgi:transcriptional regulator with XRE-family HTH domain
MTLRSSSGINLFGEYVKERREELGLSATDFAEVVGVANSTLCDVEKGRRLPALYKAQRWANALQTTVTQVAHLLLQQYVTEAGLDLVVKVKDP